VDDAFLVRVLDGAANRDEQRDAVFHRETFGIAIAGDGDAIHEFHHEKRQTGRGGAGIEDARDVGMVHQGQRLPLAFEAGDHLPAVHARLDDFERHLAADGMELRGKINRPHAALTELPDDFVWPDFGARRSRRYLAVGPDFDALSRHRHRECMGRVGILGTGCRRWVGTHGFTLLDRLFPGQSAISSSIVARLIRWLAAET
jgi:hypothetical protein